MADCWPLACGPAGAGVARGGSVATNYQIMPGDRVFVAEDGLMAFNTYLGKVTAPIERLLGLGSLGVSATRGFQTMGRNYNRTRNF